MTNPNDIQVGGDHYRSGHQHWDFVEGNHLGYLEGCATKYLTRWRSKGGIQDLEKSSHYVTKLRQLRIENKRFPRGRADEETLQDFIGANNIADDESRIIEILATWQSVEDLDEAIRLINDLILEEAQRD